MSEARIVFSSPRGRVLFDFAFSELPRRFARLYRKALRDPHAGERSNICVEPGSGNLLFELDVDELDRNLDLFAQWNLCLMFADRSCALRKGRDPDVKLLRITDCLELDVLDRMEEICHVMSGGRETRTDPPLNDVHAAVIESINRARRRESPGDTNLCDYEESEIEFRDDVDFGDLQ